MDYELMDEERHAAAAIRLLAEEAGRMTTDGALAAPSRKSYQAAVGDARRKEQAGETLSDRERILAAAPLQWWIDMYSEGWSSLVQAAGVTPAWTRKTPRALDPIVATGQSATARDHIRPEDIHPPLPPMQHRETIQRATLIDRQGRRIPAGPVQWSDLPNVVTVHVRTTEIWELR